MVCPGTRFVLAHLESPLEFGREGSVSAMAVPQRPDDPYSEGPAPETSTRRLRELSQLDFELDFLGGILARDPLNADVLKVHADNLASKGIYNRALQADQQLVRLRGERPIPWYNLACSYALLGMTDKAFAALERALRLGYSHFAHLRRDPDLKSLRRDPRFGRLLRRY
jgi:tetratricopeptide (TPR) repeat protein